MVNDPVSDSGERAGAQKRGDRAQDEQVAHHSRIERLRSGDSSLQGVKVYKVCCVCGTVLNNRPRFKDSDGRYWCSACNESDHQLNRPAPCADCGVEMSRRDLKEVRGLLLCPVCVTKVVNETKSVAQVRLKALAHGHNDALVEKTGNVPWAKIATGLVLLVLAIIVLIVFAR